MLHWELPLMEVPRGTALNPAVPAPPDSLHQNPWAVEPWEQVFLEGSQMDLVHS